MGEINRTLPRDLSLCVAEYLAPNLLFPTHPMEMMHQDNELKKYLLICKSWKSFFEWLLYERISFKSMDECFVNKRHWNDKVFANFYQKRLDGLRSFANVCSDQSYQAFLEQQKQLFLYRDVSSIIAYEGGEMGHKPISPACLKLLEYGFVSPFVKLLPSRQYELWRYLFQSLLDSYDVSTVQKNKEKIKILITAFKRQYDEYKAEYGRLLLIEDYFKVPFSNPEFSYQATSENSVFDGKIIERFCRLNLKNSALINLFNRYLIHGGFFYEPLRKIVKEWFCNKIDDEQYNEYPHDLFKRLLVYYDFTDLFVSCLRYIVKNAPPPEHKLLVEKILIDYGDISQTVTIDYKNFALELCSLPRDSTLLIPTIHLFFKRFGEYFKKKDFQQKSFFYHLLSCDDDVLDDYGSFLNGMYVTLGFINVFEQDLKNCPNDEKTEYKSLFKGIWYELIIKYFGTNENTYWDFISTCNKFKRFFDSLD